MKRVLMVGNSDIVIYNFRKELIDRFIADGYEVYISLPKGQNVDILIRKGCHFIETDVNGHGKNPIDEIKLIYTYRKIIKEVKPDVVLTYTIKPNIYCGFACQATKTPQIANITGLGSAVENPGLLQKITVQLYRLAFKKISCVFFQNEENREFFKKKHMARGPQRLIPGSGVNLSEFVPLAYPKDNIVNFLFVGRIIREKGIDQFLQAAEIIKSKYVNTSFRVIGKCSEEYKQVLKDYEDRGIIWYAGMQNDVKPFLQSAHCIIQPSYYPEGMSNALLEAEACARPVITTNRSGCRETLEHRGKRFLNGFMFEPKDTAGLVEQIEKFLALSYDQKRTMGLESRKKVEREFDRKVVIDAYLEEIDRIVDSPAKHATIPEPSWVHIVEKEEAVS